MTENDKNTLYQLAPKTVDSEGVQVFPKPQDELKKSEWISEILGSWNRVETNYIPVSVMELWLARKAFLRIASVNAVWLER